MSESLKEIYSGCENHTRLLWHFVSKLQQLAGSRCFFSWYPTQLCWSISILCCLFWFRKTSQQLFKRDPLGLLLFLLKGASCICFSCRDLFKSHPQQQLPLPLVFSLHGELSLPLKYDEFTPEHKLSCPFNPHLWMQQGVPVLLPCPGSSSAQMLPKEGYKTHLGAAPHLPQVWEHPRRGRYVKLSPRSTLFAMEDISIFITCLAADSGLTLLLPPSLLILPKQQWRVSLAVLFLLWSVIQILFLYSLIYIR